MRITEHMVNAFEDADYITRFAKTTEDSALLRSQVRAGLEAVAPQIAEQAIPGFIEIGAQLKTAHELLTRVSERIDSERWSGLARDIEEFLA